MKSRLLPLLSLVCLLSYPWMPLTLTPPSLGALATEFPPDLLPYFCPAGSRAADALVRLGFMVVQPGEIIPLALWSLAFLVLFCHGWLWCAATLALLGRAQPFGFRPSMILGAVAFGSIGFLVFYEPMRTRAWTAWPLLPLGGVALLLLHLIRLRVSPQGFPCRAVQDGAWPRQWLRWLGRVSLDGVLAATLVHILHFGVERFLPRDLIDPPFARLIGLATPFLTERLLLVSVVPLALLASAHARAPRAPLATAVSTAALLAGFILTGGLCWDWTFGRIFVASLLEPLVLGSSLAGGLFWLRRRNHPPAPLTRT